MITITRVMLVLAIAMTLSAVAPSTTSAKLVNPF